MHTAIHIQSLMNKSRQMLTCHSSNAEETLRLVHTYTHSYLDYTHIHYILKLSSYM